MLTDDLTGRDLGKYELRERIGRGGMAEVYKAYHQPLDRFVALKVMHSFLGDDPEFKDRFEREARNVAKLRHQNIVQVYDFDSQRDLYYMVMEYIDGPTLRNLILDLESRGERLPSEEVIRISRGLGGALSYAHAREMIHRDIKPGNIMIDSDRRVVLADFGIAKIASGKQITASGTMIGTPAYMAPEQGLGQPGDHRSDLYSLGVVMFQLAAGILPYDADTPIALVLKHVNEPLPDLRVLNPTIPRGLERVIYKCLAKAPDERYQTADELVNHLDNLDVAAKVPIPDSTTTQQLSITGPLGQSILDSADGPPTLVTRREQEFTRNRRTFALVGGGIAAIIAVTAIATALLMGGNRPDAPPDVAAESPVAGVSDAPPAEASPTEEPGVSADGIPPLTATPTIDLELTSMLATLDIVRFQQATARAAGTINPEDTALPPLVDPGCLYAFEIVSQRPADLRKVLENTTTAKTIVIQNSGECEWEAGTRLEYLDGSLLDAPEEIMLDAAVEPGAVITLEFDIRIPPYDPLDRTVQTTWRLVTPGGQRIGGLLTYTIEIVMPTATPTFTRTPTPDGTLTPTATSAP